jgi:hypothetical protein
VYRKLDSGRREAETRYRGSHLKRKVEVTARLRIPAIT